MYPPPQVPYSIRFCSLGRPPPVEAEQEGCGGTTTLGEEEPSYVVGPGMEETLKAVFEVQMSEVQNSGVCDADVELTNIHNPRNTVQYRLTARVIAGTYPPPHVICMYPPPHMTRSFGRSSGYTQARILLRM
jgi:hypothetical protein